MTTQEILALLRGLVGAGRTAHRRALRRLRREALQGTGGAREAAAWVGMACAILEGRRDRGLLRVH